MIAANPSAFRVIPQMQGQNVYNGGVVNRYIAAKQHYTLCETLGCVIANIPGDLPDVVFMANAGLVLPRLPVKVIVLSKMKYSSRIQETVKIKQLFEEMGFITYASLDVFEGQGETKWFLNDTLLLVGYGFRCMAVASLRNLLGRIYKLYGVVPPRVIGLELISPYWYHLDMAMAYVNSTTAIVHEAAFAPHTIKRIRKLIQVAQIRVDDPFCLNCICTTDTLYTHVLKPSVYKLMRALTKLDIVEIDVSEFEKAGGSVRCMILDI